MSNIIGAAYSNDVRRLLEAIQDGESVNTQEVDTQLTALHIAVANNHLEMIDVLLRQTDIDLVAKDRWGRDATQIALDNGFQSDVVKKLIDRRTGQQHGDAQSNERLGRPTKRNPNPRPT